MLTTTFERGKLSIALLALICVNLDTVQAELIANYTFENNYDDSSGNGHTGEPIGLAGFADDPVRGNVLEVPLDGDGVDIHFVSPIPDFPAQKSITFAAWVKRTGVQDGGNNQYVVNLGGDGDNPVATLGVRANEDTVTGFIETDGPGNDRLEVRGITAIEAGADAWADWHHIAVVYDRVTDIGRIYLDGVQDSSVDISFLDDAEAQSWTRATIGTDSSFGASLSSRIDDVYIYDEALTAGQISDLIGVAALEVEVDRGTGNLQLTNISSTLPLTIRGYSITSNFGSLNSDRPAWTPISGNYDEADNGGDGSVDEDDPWLVLTGTGVRTDLSEVELSGGNGGVIGAGQSVNLGDVWIKSPTEDLAIEVLLADGTVKNFAMQFSGGPNKTSFQQGDLDFDGAVDADDWSIFRSNNLSDLSGLSLAEAYGRGDLDGSGTNDILDFILFKSNYEAAFGVGALEALITQVPEPLSLVLLGGCLTCGFMFRNRRTGKLSQAVGSLMVVGIVLLIAPSDATAQLVDFSTFTVQNYPATNGFDSNFAPPIYDTSTSTTANLTASAGYHVFYGTDSILNKRIIGTMNPGGDENILGLVLGYSAGEVSDNPNPGQFNPDADYLLLDWKQVSQESGFNDFPGSGNSFHDLTPISAGHPLGLALSRVSGLPTGDELWGHVADLLNLHGGVTELARGATLGSTGYTANTEVTFDITYTPTNVTIHVDGVEQFNIDGSFGDGGFGLYGIGQSATKGPVPGPIYFRDFEITTLNHVLVATVNLGTGDVTISNESSSPIALDFYQLTSPSGSLDSINWNSLQDQNLPSFPAGNGTGNGWEESGGANSFSLGEGFLTGISTLGSGQSFVLANAYNTEVDAQDILLSYRESNEIVTGNLAPAYIEPVVDADFDGDDDVDGRDFLSWQQGFGLTEQVSNSNGDADGSGAVDSFDLAVWEQQFGSVSSPSAVQGVPEPGCMVLAALGIVGIASRGRRRNC